MVKPSAQNMGNKEQKHDLKNSLGCGERCYTKAGGIKPPIPTMNTIGEFICGVPNAWGKEDLCIKCQIKLRRKWDEEDIIKTQGGKN